MIDIVSSSDRTMTVGECCESIYSGGTPSTKKAAYWNGNLPWLSSGETRCRFIIDTEKTITELGVAESSTKLAKAGDVVMASAGQGFTRGQTSMLFFDTYVNQSVVVMRPKRDYGAYLLLMLAAQYDNLRAWSDSTSTRGSMSGKLLRQFELPYFDVEQAKELTAFTAPMFAMIEKNMRESKALAQTRDALLPKLMSGEIDVSEVELPKQPNSHLSSFSIRSCCVRSFGRHRAFLLRGGGNNFLYTGPVISRCGCDGRQSEHPCKEHGECEGKCPLSRHAGLCPAMGRLLLCAVLVRHDASIPSDFERQKFP